ncbi:MAG: MFS transporter [Marinomonas sp.]
MTQGATPLPLRTKLAYGFGSAAFGVKDSGFNYFLLLFYGTVIGLDPALVGLAIFIALAADAFSDPLVGYWSDNFRSKWGRRHPFMYAAAVPIALTYFLLWNPPDWSQTALFWYVLILAIVIRTLITFYETPSSALMPELTQDYEERTSLQSFRLFFGWSGGNAMSVLMWGVLLVATAEYSEGSLNREGYATYGIIASILMLAAILISAVGTHSYIPQLREAPPREVRSIRAIFAEILETLRDKSFGSLFIATLFGQIATGFSAALAFLLLSFFWGFSPAQIFIYTLLVFVSAAISLAMAPKAVRMFGKKRAVMIIGCIAFTVAPLAVVLRLMGLLPENGDPMLFPIIAVINTLDLGLIIAFQAISYSMIAELVEQSELKTGRRSEGVFYAAITFTRKASVGLGGAMAGLLLGIITFPQGEAAANASDEKLWQLGAAYAPVLWLLWTVMLIAISRYTIDKSQHEANLKELAKRDAG